MSLLDKASLIVTPNAYKESKLYSVVPNTTLGDMDVVRATTATRVNSAGLIEYVPYNFVTYTEDFNNASWVTVSVTKTTGITDAFGTSNGVRISDIGSGNTSDFIINNAIAMNLSGGDIINYSVYLKGTGTIGLALERGGSGDYFFTTQVVTLTNTWTRYNFSYTIPSGFRNGLQYYITNLTGTTATSVDICFPQITYGTTVKDYQRTTTRLNIPRIDYTNGSCPSLLVEPQRTNLFNYSEQFNSSVWDNSSGVTFTSNVGISPDGSQNADRLLGSGAWYTARPLILTLGTTYTYTIYVKSNTGSNQTFRLFSNGVNVLSPTLTANNQWQRFTLTFTANVDVYQGIISDAAFSSADLLVWGIQLEAGSYATSYIPTVASSVTRNADVISKTGISSLIGQTEGTMFAEVNISNFDTSADQLIVQLFKNSTNRFGINIYRDGANNKFQFFQLFGGSLQVNIESIASSGVFKLAGAYKNNDYIFYINGVQIGSDTSASVPDTSEINIGSLASGNQFGNRIKSVQLYKTRLTNTELAQLTTL